MKVFATRVWGFDPETRPFMTFGLEGNRDKLLRESAPGDLIIFVGTQTPPTRDADQGRILGMAEIGRVPIDTAEVLDREELGGLDLGHNGLRFPKAIAMLRAWRFTPPPLLTKTLTAQLTYQATPSAVELGERDVQTVLALPMITIELPRTEKLERLRLLDETLSSARPTTGPTPASWSGSASRDVNRRAFTYAFRFGKTDVWKIGHAIDVKDRLKQVNCHIPTEVISELWAPIYTQPWPDEVAAHAMEQRVLGALSSKRTSGERVRCPESVVWDAWKSAIGL